MVQLPLEKKNLLETTNSTNYKNPLQPTRSKVYRTYTLCPLWNKLKKKNRKEELLHEILLFTLNIHSLEYFFNTFAPMGTFYLGSWHF
jgi:hypothetical protein